MGNSKCVIFDHEISNISPAMRETNFIRQNQQKWEEFEEILDGHAKDPERLQDLFVKVTDDLSFSRTFYSNRSVRVYLNGLAQRAFSMVYSKRRKLSFRPGAFWLDELPQLIWESRFELLLSAGVFLLSMLIGVLSSVYDDSFAQLILGEAYVSMTEANIESGDPMAVYKARASLSMSVGITVNNLWVAFLTFVSGLFFCLGSLFILIRNGIMVGAFQYFFMERDLFWDSFLTIWMHGTLEISSIILAGAAGITMGKGLVFPGTYRRIQAFQRSARRGLKILVGITPVFILAGFIEGFFTRYTDAPDVLRGLFIGSSFLFVVVYFVYYPWSKSRIGFFSPLKDAEIPSDRELRLDLGRVKNNGEVFSDVLLLVGKYAGMIARLALLAAGFYLLLLLVLVSNPFEVFFESNSGITAILSGITNIFYQNQYPWLILLGALWGGILIFGVLVLLERTIGVNISSMRIRVLSTLPAACCIPVLVFFTQERFPIFLAFFGQFFLLWSFATLEERANLGKGLVKMLQLTANHYSRTLGLSALMLLAGMLAFTIADTSLTWFLLNLITLVVDVPEEAVEHVSGLVLTTLHLWLMGVFFLIYGIGYGLLYHNLAEIQEARGLMQNIPLLGTGNKIRGMEKE